MPPIDSLLQRLLRVRSVRFESRGELSDAWNGSGEGEVVVESPAAGQVILTETGVWRPEREDRPAVEFRNVLRWAAIKADEPRVRLEHLRFGVDHPTPLFDLAPAPGGEWRSVEPHQCADDRYAATLECHDDCLLLNWLIHGPRKRERLLYRYSCVP